MIRCDEFQNRIEQCLDLEKEFPSDVEDHLSHCAICREYQGGLKSLMDTLDGIQFPAPPEQLVDDVMLYIRQREPQLVPVASSVNLNIVSEMWRALMDLFPSFEIPQVLRQEAWPSAFASLAVVWGVLIAPNVQAGKIESQIENLKELPIVYQVDRYADELKLKSEEAADQVITFAAEILNKAYPGLVPTPAHDRLERTRPYLES